MLLCAAWTARSPALLAFGGDSAVELISAVVVLRRFHAPAAHEQGDLRAARIAGALLFALGSVCDCRVRYEATWSHRTQAKLSGDCRVDCGRNLHAVACERETAVVGGDG
jgi:hypothetical protein